MRKLKMPKQQLNNFEDVFHIFEASQNAKGVSETTLNNYKCSLIFYLIYVAFTLSQRQAHISG